MNRPPDLTFRCGCGERLYVWVSEDGRYCLRAQHGENAEHSIDLAPGSPASARLDGAVIVTRDRVYHGRPAAGDQWLTDVSGWWIDAVHERQGIPA